MRAAPSSSSSLNTRSMRIKKATLFTYYSPPRWRMAQKKMLCSNNRYSFFVVFMSWLLLLLAPSCTTTYWMALVTTAAAAAATAASSEECVADFAENGIQCIEQQQQQQQQQQQERNENHDPTTTATTPQKQQQQQQHIHIPPLNRRGTAQRRVAGKARDHRPAAAGGGGRGGGGGQQQERRAKKMILHFDRDAKENNDDDDAEQDLASAADEDDDDEEEEFYDDIDVNNKGDDTSCTDFLGRLECAKRAAAVAEGQSSSSSKFMKKDGCILDFVFMQRNCRRTCLQCDLEQEMQQRPQAIRNLYSDFAQNINQPNRNEEKQAIRDYLQSVDAYMYQTIYNNIHNNDEQYEKLRLPCRNRNADCTYWAFLGECTANPAYMTIHCAPACRTCENVLFENRCPFDADTLPIAWSQPGDVSAMFERIVAPDSVWNRNYKITIHSQPSPPVPALPGPWVVTLDDFVNETECQMLIELGAARGYERSEDVNDEMLFDGTFAGIVSRDRTSTNAWCDHDDCYKHALTQAVLHRMEQLTNIPEMNFEHLQLLKYEVGQFYGCHHDYIEIHAQRAPGPRILTVFIYLNNVTAGGGTNFPLLNNLTIMPRQGRVLLWPSVLDESPMDVDERTEHQALPVEEGIKYAANAWVHSRDWKTALNKNCH